MTRIWLALLLLVSSGCVYESFESPTPFFFESDTGGEMDSGAEDMGEPVDMAQPVDMGDPVDMDEPVDMSDPEDMGPDMSMPPDMGVDMGPSCPAFEVPTATSMTCGGQVAQPFNGACNPVTQAPCADDEVCRRGLRIVGGDVVGFSYFCAPYDCDSVEPVGGTCGNSDDCDRGLDCVVNRCVPYCIGENGLGCEMGRCNIQSDPEDQVGRCVPVCN